MGKTAKDRRINSVLSVVLTIVCILWMYPVFMILMNSLKTETCHHHHSAPSSLPTAETFAGLSKLRLTRITEPWASCSSLRGTAFIITISSVRADPALLLACAHGTSPVCNCACSPRSCTTCACSAWWCRSRWSCSPSPQRQIPLRLNTPWNICIIYLGFGAGLAVFMFTGFVKSIPIEIEEAAMIDGCNPIQTYFQSGFPHPEAPP